MVSIAHGWAPLRRGHGCPRAEWLVKDKSKGKKIVVRITHDGAAKGDHPVASRHPSTEGNCIKSGVVS